jgi:hypothetical protein
MHSFGRPNHRLPVTILRMNALQGIIRSLRRDRARIDAALRALAMLSTSFGSRAPGKRRTLSAAARRRIAAAQRARWARWKARKR